MGVCAGCDNSSLLDWIKQLISDPFLFDQLFCRDFEGIKFCVSRLPKRPTQSLPARTGTYDFIMLCRRKFFFFRVRVLQTSDTCEKSAAVLQPNGQELPTPMRDYLQWWWASTTHISSCPRNVKFSKWKSDKTKQGRRKNQTSRVSWNHSLPLQQTGAGARSMTDTPLLK